MEHLEKIAGLFKEHGIESYYVGGCVRDEFMGLPVDDIDICLVGAKSRDQVNDIFSEILLGDFIIDSIAREVGETFPVWILQIEGKKIDYAMARTEKLIGNTRTDFSVFTENVTIEDDLSRRDLTINAIAKNVLTGHIIDPFMGRYDIEYKFATHVSKSFAEDTLRVIRAARFIARFDLTPTQHFLNLCRTLSPTDISNERVGMELMKTFQQAKQSSKFFEFLREVNWLQYYFQELKDLIGIRQSPIHHPEGDAYTHTLLCIDKADSSFMKAVMLCHDLGKAETTVINLEIDPPKISAIGHEEVGVALTRTMLKRIHFSNHKTINQISVLVKLHMLRSIISKENHVKMVRRTLRELMNNELEYWKLVEVVRFDLSGRSPLPAPKEGEELIFESYAFKLEKSGMMQQIVTGKLLIEEGFQPSPEFGKITERALELQDRGLLTKENWRYALMSSGILSRQYIDILKYNQSKLIKS